MEDKFKTQRIIGIKILWSLVRIEWDCWICTVEKKKKIPQRPRSVARELIPHRPLSRRGWNPIKLAYRLAGWPAQLATSAFSQLSMPAVLVTGHTVTQDSPFSSLAVAVTIASTHFTYPRRDDQAELAWVAWLNAEMVYSRTVTHLSTNPARRWVTSLMCPLSHTATVCTVEHEVNADLVK